MNIKRQWTTSLTVAALAASACAGAVSLSTTGPAQPVPDTLAVAASLPVAESLSPGSAALIPLVAADLPAVSAVIANDITGGGDIGKPIDDLDFVARATETGRQQVKAASDALPQLQDPELKRIAETLVSDGGDANARLTRMAEIKRWPVPSPQRADAQPAGTASPDFDINWTDDMISSQERSLALYSAQAQGGEDSDVRRYARETIPTIQSHLAELRRLQK